jgi:protein TonB
MFEDSTFESAGRIRTRSRRWMIVTLALNGSILLALIVIPLLYPEVLPRRMLPFLLAAPTEPMAERPPQPKDVSREFHGKSEMNLGRILAPITMPSVITILHDPEPPAPEGSMTGMGQDQGLPNGGDDVFRGNRPNAVLHAENNGPARVSSGVMTGLLIDRVKPPYPAIAKAAGIQGTVILQATISKSGTIENLRVINGHAMLQQAALDAVKSWRYRPYLLNGEPIEVETTVNVVFSLGR